MDRDRNYGHRRFISNDGYQMPQDFATSLFLYNQRKAIKNSNSVLLIKKVRINERNNILRHI